MIKIKKKYTVFWIFLLFSLCLTNSTVSGVKVDYLITNDQNTTPLKLYVNTVYKNNGGLDVNKSTNYYQIDLLCNQLYYFLWGTIGGDDFESLFLEGYGNYLNFLYMMENPGAFHHVFVFKLNSSGTYNFTFKSRNEGGAGTSGIGFFEIQNITLCSYSSSDNGCYTEPFAVVYHNFTSYPDSIIPETIDSNV